MGSQPIWATMGVRTVIMSTVAPESTAADCIRIEEREPIGATLSSSAVRSLSYGYRRIADLDDAMLDRILTNRQDLIML